MPQAHARHTQNYKQFATFEELAKILHGLEDVFPNNSADKSGLGLARLLFKDGAQLADFDADCPTISLAAKKLQKFS
jgi:hypothetical protein